MSKLNVSVGLSTSKDPLHAAEEALQQAKYNLVDGKIDLAIVFSTINLAQMGLLKTLELYLKDAPIIGCSSAAVINGSSIYRYGVGVMLIGFPEDVYFNTGVVSNVSSKTTFTAGQELGEKLLYGFRDVRRDLSIIFSDGLIKEGSRLIYGLQQRLGTSFPLIGACASDNLEFNRTYQFHNQELLSDAVCGLLLGGKINFGLGSQHGWQPLGKMRKVTKSEGNIVYTIDNMEAADLYVEYFGFNMEELRKELKHISVLYPIGIFLPGEKEYLLRNIVSFRDDGSIVFQGDVPQDSQIRLMIGTKESCLLATKLAVEAAKKRLAGHKINFVLVFNSISRYILLGRNAEKELEILKEGFGKDVPILGFYSYGEQSPLTAINYRGKSYFHNQTVTVLAIGS